MTCLVRDNIDAIIDASYSDHILHTQRPILYFTYLEDKIEHFELKLERNLKKCDAVKRKLTLFFDFLYFFFIVQLCLNFLYFLLIVLFLLLWLQKCDILIINEKVKFCQTKSTQRTSLNCRAFYKRSKLDTKMWTAQIYHYLKLNV